MSASNLKSIAKKLFFILSGIAFFALFGCPYTKTSICVTIEILAMFCIFVWKTRKFQKFELEVPSKDNRNLYLGAALMSAFMGYYFYNNMQDSEMYIPICAVIGALVSIPFLVYVLKLLFNTVHIPKNSHIEKLNAYLSSDKCFRHCMILSAVGVLAMLVFCFSPDIWYDEAFSLALIKHSYTDVIRLTAADVHPPLYYLILKVVTDGVHFIAPNIPTVYIAKLVSVVPYLILFALFAVKVRHERGNYVAGVGALCVIGTSPLIKYAVEIRMYGYGLLFVTLAFLFASDILEKKTGKAWTGFVVFSLCAAYTHYFACVAVGVIWLTLLVWFFMNVEERKRLKAWFIAAVVTAVGYLPWLFVLMQQLSKVSQGYWIDDLTLGTVLEYAVYMFTTIPVFLIGLTLIVCIVKELKCTSFKQQKLYLSLAGICVPIGTVFIGTMVSFLMRPVFLTRYMIPGLACLWFGMLYAANNLKQKLFRVILPCVMVLICCFQILLFMLSEHEYMIKSKSSMAFIGENENAVYLADVSEDCNIILTLSELTNSECLFWNKSVSTSYTRVFKNNLDSIYSADELLALIRTGKTVYFVEDDYNLSVEEVLADSGVNYEYVGSYRFQSQTKLYLLTE